MSKRTAQADNRIAIAYLRASKDEQRLSPEAQRSAIKAWAARERVRVVAWCLDQGVRSVTPVAHRPGLRAALDAVCERGAGLLVVARRDRIARDVVLAACVERAAAEIGARIVSASGEGNGDSPADAFMRTVIDGAAQYEHGLIRARTRAALASKRARGELVGSVPFGFALDNDGVRLVPVAHEQATIARARALHVRHLSLRTIATRLASEGRVSRTGRQFLAEQVARMLNGPPLRTRRCRGAARGDRSSRSSPTHCASRVARTSSSPLGV
jgi:DNA invertase Pin-like site-specific DNA recombinase